MDEEDLLWGPVALYFLKVNNKDSAINPVYFNPWILEVNWTSSERLLIYLQFTSYFQGNF